MFSRAYHEIFKKIYFEEHLKTAASAYRQMRSFYKSINSRFETPVLEQPFMKPLEKIILKILLSKPLLKSPNSRRRKL